MLTKDKRNPDYILEVFVMLQDRTKKVEGYNNAGNDIHRLFEPTFNFNEQTQLMDGKSKSDEVYYNISISLHVRQSIKVSIL